MIRQCFFEQSNPELGSAGLVAEQLGHGLLRVAIGRRTVSGRDVLRDFPCLVGLPLVNGKVSPR
jgi:hypothetical protein